jgi:putative DNA primase/helicase
LLLKDRDAIPNDVAGLTGARLVVTSELTGGRSLNESMVKDLTGGDSITARFLHQEFFTFTPIFKIWMYGNAKPTIRGTDDGIWRRIRLIPFTVQIPEDERDGALVGKLRQELPGVLNWALAGWKAYQAEGLRPSEAVSRATDAYREQSDALGQFIADCCLVQDGATCQSKLLHDAYVKWGGALTAVKFAQVMQERGFTKKREMHGMTWQGVGLLADSM